MKQFECKHESCGHKWWPRKFDEKGKPIKPKVCPICKRTTWEKGKTKKK